MAFAGTLFMLAFAMHGIANCRPAVQAPSAMVSAPAPELRLAPVVTLLANIGRR